MMTALAFERELALARERVTASVKADGADAHQIAVDHLVWAHAYVEAARAMVGWAERAGDDAVRALAEAAGVEASCVISGRSMSASVRDWERLAEIGAGPLPAIDLGASQEHRLLRAAV